MSMSIVSFLAQLDYGILSLLNAVTGSFSHFCRGGEGVVSKKGGVDFFRWGLGFSEGNFPLVIKYHIRQEKCKL